MLWLQGSPGCHHVHHLFLRLQLCHSGPVASRWTGSPLSSPHEPSQVFRAWLRGPVQVVPEWRKQGRVTIHLCRRDPSPPVQAAGQAAPSTHLLCPALSEKAVGSSNEAQAPGCVTKSPSVCKGEGVWPAPASALEAHTRRACPQVSPREMGDFRGMRLRLGPAAGWRCLEQ